MAKTVTGLFDKRDYAEMAARRIKEQGLKTDDISIIAKQDGDNGRGAGFVNARNTAGGAMGENARVNDNISDGVVSGSILGGIAGLAIGAGSLIVPGLGVIAAAGPIAGLLSGTATGGIVGGLVDLGIPENRSRQYENDIRQGKILFSMKADDDKADRIASILRNSGASSVNIY